MAQPGISGVGRAGHDFTGSAPFFSINRARFRSVILALASASLPRGKSPTRACNRQRRQSARSGSGRSLRPVVSHGAIISHQRPAPSHGGASYGEGLGSQAAEPRSPRPETWVIRAEYRGGKWAEYQKPRRGCRRGLGWQRRGGSLPKLAMGQRGIGGTCCPPRD